VTVLLVATGGRIGVFARYGLRPRAGDLVG
jgi:hypothetical protein